MTSPDNTNAILNAISDIGTRSLTEHGQILQNICAEGRSNLSETCDAVRELSTGHNDLSQAIAGSERRIELQTASNALSAAQDIKSVLEGQCNTSNSIKQHIDSVTNHNNANNTMTNNHNNASAERTFNEIRRSHGDILQGQHNNSSNTRDFMNALDTRNSNSSDRNFKEITAGQSNIERSLQNGNTYINSGLGIIRDTQGDIKKQISDTHSNLLYKHSKDMSGMEIRLHKDHCDNEKSVSKGFTDNTLYLSRDIHSLETKLEKDHCDIEKSVSKGFADNTLYLTRDIHSLETNIRKDTNDLNSNLAEAFNRLTHSQDKSFCQVQLEMLKNTHSIEKQSAAEYTLLKADICQTKNDLSKQLSDCCCELKMGQSGTNSLIQAVESTNIRDKLADARMELLSRKFSDHGHHGYYNHYGGGHGGGQ